uniref:Odorant receptor n=1 Tax=Galleria mellonella TaxID=7137 RepID=A0A5C0E601_GALME|nr:odorant receptor 41 [Galleria mellonella]
MKKSGLILPDTGLLKYVYVIIHLTGTLFIVSQYVELYVIRSDINLVISNLMITMMSEVCFLKADSCVFWQKQWRELIDYITEADKFERDNSDQVKRKIFDKYKTYCRKISYSYWAITFTTFIVLISTPLIHFLPFPSQNEVPQNRTEVFSPIFSSWMPFDKYSSPGCWITALWHISLCASGGLSMTAYDCSSIVIMMFFECKLDLFRQRCREMLGSNDKAISDQDAEIVIRQLHKIHIKIIKYMRLFNSLLSPLMFFYIFNCSLMLCACGYQITSTSNAAQRLLVGEYFVFGIAQLFVFCWHSNKVIVKIDSLMYGPFESNWCPASVRQKKYVLFLSGQLRIQHIFTAGPFTNLTLSTFITILKGAYSYYMLLRK